jgi:hypothetical protein
MPNAEFTALIGGLVHSFALTADGSLVAWGCGTSGNYGECNVPAPNAGFVAIAPGAWAAHGLAIRRLPGDMDANGIAALPDFTEFQIAFDGPDGEPPTGLPRFFDLDLDEDIDLRDYAGFANQFGD